MTIFDGSNATIVVELGIFLEFLQTILDDLADRGIQRRCFTMDTLKIHHDPVVEQMILTAGHRVVYRAPYWPKDGPIEYVFNALEGNLRRNFYNIRTGVQLELAILRYFNSRESFVSFFTHVGFN